MLELDHVMIVVADLEESQWAFKERFGLNSVFGGRHSGFGTANRIIPFGRTFLELLAIVDHDEFIRGGLSLPQPECFGAWAVRTKEIDSLADQLGVSVGSMSRRREDGVYLEWRIAGLELFGVDPAQPLVLDWSADEDWHPARTEIAHDVPIEGIGWVEISGDRDGIARWRHAATDLEVRVVEGPPAVRALGLTSPDGDIEIRYDGND